MDNHVGCVDVDNNTPLRTFNDHVLSNHEINKRRERMHRCFGSPRLAYGHVLVAWPARRCWPCEQSWRAKIAEPKRMRRHPVWSSVEIDNGNPLRALETVEIPDSIESHHPVAENPAAARTAGQGQGGG